jgi:hypothetical protein
MQAQRVQRELRVRRVIFDQEDVDVVWCHLASGAPAAPKSAFTSARTSRPSLRGKFRSSRIGAREPEQRLCTLVPREDRAIGLNPDQRAEQLLDHGW